MVIWSSINIVSKERRSLYVNVSMALIFPYFDIGSSFCFHFILGGGSVGITVAIPGLFRVSFINVVDQIIFKFLANFKAVLFLGSVKRLPVNKRFLIAAKR